VRVYADGEGDILLLRKLLSLANERKVMGGSVGVVPHDIPKEEMKGVFVYLILSCDLSQAQDMFRSVGVDPPVVFIDPILVGGLGR